MKQYALSVVIGRFQILHDEHVRIIEHAKSIGDNTLVIVGSADEPRSTRNPFTFDERVEMLRAVFGSSILIGYVPDTPYRDDMWLNRVHNVIAQHASRDIVIVGCDKDHTTAYLGQFQKYSVELMDDGGINSTRLRRNLYTNEWQELRKFINPKVFDWLRDWAAPNGIASKPLLELRAKHFRERLYKDQYGSGPFVAADALVTNYDTVLVIKREDGTYALPGGFMNGGETWESASKRECLEETGLDISQYVPSEAVVFDTPLRDPRAHIITKVFHYDLHLPIWPTVQGMDDAKEAMWMNFADFHNQRLNFYADHWSIIDRML